MSHIANGISSWLQEPRLTSCPRQLHAGLALIFAEKMSRMVRYYFIIGLPGFVTIEDDAVQTTALQIATVYVVRNPEKLPAPQ